MPKSLEWILAHQDELAEQFENFEADREGQDEAHTYARLLQAAVARAEAEAAIADAVVAARTDGYSWAMIGGAVGTTGQAAQQRYGKVVDAAGARR